LEQLVAWSKGEGKSWKENLTEILSRLEAPRRIRNTEEFYREATRLRAAVEVIESWNGLEKQTQQALIGTVAARCRHLQDEAAPELKHPFGTDTIKGLFSIMTAWSATNRPGFVIGLMHTHSPVRASWVEDAIAWWEDLQGILDPSKVGNKTNESRNPERAVHGLIELAIGDTVGRDELQEAVLTCLDDGVSPDDPRIVKALLPYVDLLQRESRLKAVRKAVRKYNDSLNAVERAFEKDTNAIPTEWPYWDQVRGKRAILIGGNPKDTSRQKIEERFTFASLEWESGYQLRKLESIASRVESGGIDIVIFLTSFLSHKAWDVIGHRSDRLPFILVERGYGITQIQAAMEKHFSK
jgi:hypothetical protein